MTVTLCDICRKEIDMSNQKTKTINKLSFGNYGTSSWLWHSEFDLCPECGNALTAWVKMMKKEQIMIMKNGR